MNRAQRRAERFTKRGRLDQAERERHICEHGNPKKTDGNGNPMCPHGCGFATVEDMPPACPHCRLIGGGHLRGIYLAANPIFPMEVQFPKMYLLGWPVRVHMRELDRAEQDQPARRLGRRERTRRGA